MSDSGRRDRPEPSAARWLGWPTALLLAVLHLGLALSSARHESATFDEGLHITAGYTNLLLADQRLHSGNGLLAQAWFALPLVLDADRFRFPNPDHVIATQPVDDFHLLTHFLSHVFFYEAGNAPADILARARIMAALLGAALCAAVYAWARKLWGRGPAVLSTALCAFSPNVLAHARLATSDLMFTTLLIVSLGAVWSSFWRPRLGSLLVAGASLGALAATKLSALGALPMIGVLIALRACWPTPLPWLGGAALASPGRRAAGLAVLVLAQGLTAVAVIWAIYGFRYEVVPDGVAGREVMEQQWAWVHEREGLAISGIDQLRRARVLPEGFLFGAAFVFRHAEERNSFFRGDTHVGGDWRFFPYAIAVKTPLALFGLLTLSALALSRAGPAERRRAALVAAPLLVLIGVHGAIAVTSGINLGLRHVLPLYPAAFILAGGAALGLGSAAAVRRTAVAALAVAFIAASISIWPHYLAYFNRLVGPANGYRVLVDSSLDWGQALDRLRDYLAALPEAERRPVYLSYFGTADPSHNGLGLHGLDVRFLPGFFDWPTVLRDEATAPLDWTLEPGLYAISATMLQQPWARVSREMQPEEQHRYAALAARFAPLEHSPDPAATIREAIRDPATRDAWLYYRDLRLSRLCQVLREREPDDQIGYAIGVYRVGADELARVRPGPAEGRSPGTTNSSALAR